MYLKKQFILASSAAALLASTFSPASHAATNTWNGFEDVLWSNGANWSSVLEPTAADDVFFAAVIPATGSGITLGASELANSLQFEAAYTLSSGDLALTSGNVTVAPSITATINSALIGAGGLTKLGNGTLVLGGTNTYSGVTAVNAGTLSFSTSANLGNAAATNTIFLNGGTLSFTGSTATSLGTTRTVALGPSSGTIETLGTGALTINGVISGTTGFTKTGAGTLILSGTNLYTGGTTISAGTLQIGADANLGGAQTISLNGGTLKTSAAIITTNKVHNIGASGGTLNLTGQYRLNGANLLTGNGALLVTGSGLTSNLRLSGTNSYAGTITLQNASIELELNGAVAAGTAFNILSGGDLAVQGGTNSFSLPATVSVAVDGGTISFENGTAGGFAAPISVGASGATVALRDWFATGTARSGTISSAITGTGGLTVNSGTGSGGTLTLSNAGNTYAGNTTITSSVVVASGASLGAAGTSITLGGTNPVLAWGAAVDQAILNRITTGSTGALALGGVSSANNLDFSAFPTLSLGATGTSTYTGTLTPAGTTYRVGGGNGTLILANANALTGARDVLVTGGTGTVVLASSNNYSGSTTINAGNTLQIGNGGLVGSFNTTGALTINGTLSFNRADNVTFNSAYTGTATLNQAGSATLTLAAPSNTYARLAFSGSGRIDLGAAIVNLGVDGGNLIQATVGGTTPILVATGGGTMKLASNNGDIGGVANSRLTIDVPIVNGTGSAVDIFNGGAGAVVFNAANTYTGATGIQAGHLYASSLNRVVGGTASSSLGAPTTVATGTINIGTGTSPTSSLIYTGSGETTDRVINLGGTTAGAIIDQSGSGVLGFTSNFTATGAGIKTLTLQGSSGGSGLIAGVIVENSSTNKTSLTKAGSGTWTLRGGATGNTYTGTTSLNGGTLELDFVNATPLTNILSASSPLALGGGKLSVLGKTGAINSQTFATTTINGGGSIVSVTNSVADSTLLALGAITRNAGGTISFLQPAGALSATNGITTTTANNTSGILGGYATVGSDWATKNGTNNPVAYTAYTPSVLTGGSATTNYLHTPAASASQVDALTGATTMNSLKIVDTAATQSLALATFNLTLSGAGGAGGLMYAGGATNSYTISGGTGTLTAGANDLIISTPTAGSALTISAIVAGTGGLTKSGDGLLTLSGVNTFSGAIFINGGTLAIAGPGGTSESTALGATGSRVITLNNGGAFRVASGSYNPSGSTKVFVMGAGGGVLDIASGASLILDDGTGNTGGATGGAQLQGGGTLTKTGAGQLNLGYNGQTAAGFNAFTGNIVVAAGTLNVGNANALGSIALGTTTVNSGAVLDFNSATAFAIGEIISVGGTGLGSGALINTGTTLSTLNGPITLTAATSIGGNGAGGLTFNGPIGGAFGLTKVGTGVVTLGGVNSYAGATALTAGTLRLQRPTAIPTGSAVSVAAGTTLLVNSGAAGEFQAADMATLLGATTFANNTATFGIDTSNASASVTSPAITGTLAFNKAGTGTLILPASTYTGATTISAGTLVPGTDNALPITTTLTLGAALSTVGTLDLSGSNQTIGSLSTALATGTAANTIIIGGGKTLNVNGNVSIGPAASATNQTSRLNLTGGGNLVVTTNAGGLVAVGGNPNNSFSQAATLDLTGLASATINASATGTIRVGNTTTTNIAGNTGTLLFPTPAVAAGTLVTALTANNFNIGDAGGNNGGANQINSVVLGTGLTTINANNVNIGTGGRDVGSLTFATGNGTLTLRGATGGTSRAAFSLGGTGGATGVQNGTGVTGMLADFRGHASDLLLSSLNIGNQARISNQNYDFKFDTGTLDTTSVSIGNDTVTSNNGVPGAAATLASALVIGGGNVTIGAGGVTMGNANAARTGSTSIGTSIALTGSFAVTGGSVTIGTTGTYSIQLGNLTTPNTFVSTSDTVSITGGSVSLAGPIITRTTARTTSTIMLDGGLLDMNGNAIGGAIPISNLLLRSGTLRDAGQINDGADVSISATGTFILDGNNAYTGRTKLLSGTLFVNGNLSGSIVDIVAGTLGGTGTIAQAVNLGADAILAPGASIGDLATGDVTFDPGAEFQLEINSSTVRTDLLTSTGTIQLGLASLNLADLGGSFLSGSEIFTFITASGGVFGTFGGLADGAEITVGANTFTIDYTPTTVSLVAVPEPGSAALLLGGLASLVCLRRNRGRS